MIALTFKMLFSFTWYATAGQSGAILGAAIANLVLSGANIAMAYVSANAFVDVAYELYLLTALPEPQLLQRIKRLQQPILL